MYHTIVAMQLRRAFRAINAGAYERIVPQFLPSHRHVMFGRHALSGERRTLAHTSQWYARLQRLMPDLRFNIHAIAVMGWPWRTVAFVSWDDRFSLPDGSVASNQGVHEFQLRWGRVAELTVHCDTSRLETFAAASGAAGLAEWNAAAITELARTA